MSGRVRVRVVVRGVVQGVGYRYFAVHLAREYGIGGWVRNSEDGSVEVEAEGERGIVESFIRDLRIGPSGAEVSGLDVSEMPLGAPRGRFDVRF